MAASINDKITDTFNSANPNVARVTSTRTAGATSLACDNLAGWPTVSKVHFSTYRIDTNNAVVAGTQIDWTGIVSGNNIGSLTRMAGATDAGSAIGDVVEMNPTGSWGHDLFTGLTAEHSVSGVHALTSNSTLTSSKFITSLNDTNGNELAKVTATAAAVNEITLANAATAGAPSITASGDDTNVSLNLASKGTGEVQINGTAMSGAWTSYVPTLTNLSGGTLNYAKYKQIGKTVHVRFKYTLAGAGVGSGVSFTLPVTASSDYTNNLEIFDGSVALIDTGVVTYSGVVMWASSTTASIKVQTGNAVVYCRIDPISSTIPLTWGASDIIQAHFTYEAA